GIIRYSETNDIIRIIKFASLQFVLWLTIYSIDTNSIVTGFLPVPLLIINLFSVIFILVMFRLLVKEVYSKASQSKSRDYKKTIIYGAGEMGQVTKQVLEQDLKNNTIVVGFIEDSSSKIGKNLAGLPIYDASSPQLARLFRQK